MKNIFFSLATIAIIFSACVKDSHKKHDSHTHEDGSKHDNHTSKKDHLPQQESFVVEFDSASVTSDTLKREHKKAHSHGDGHKHTH